MTKEEILKRELNGEELEFLSDNSGNIHDAMEYYARQEVVEFDKWKFESGWKLYAIMTYTFSLKGQ